jgi:hypothetical protein
VRATRHQVHHEVCVARDPAARRQHCKAQRRDDGTVKTDIKRILTVLDLPISGGAFADVVKCSPCDRHAAVIDGLLMPPVPPVARAMGILGSILAWMLQFVSSQRWCAVRCPPLSRHQAAEPTCTEKSRVGFSIALPPSVHLPTLARLPSPWPSHMAPPRCPPGALGQPAPNGTLIVSNTPTRTDGRDTTPCRASGSTTGRPGWQVRDLC